MAVYKFIGAYRGVNKVKENAHSEFPHFYNFKKEDIVEAEEYTPDNVKGVRFGKGMMLVSNAFIVPATYLKKVEGAELEKVLEKLGATTEAEPTEEANVVKVEDLTPEQQAVVENKASMKELTKKSKNIGIAAMAGGMAGFGISYYMKKNVWMGTFLGIATGVVGILVFNSIKDANETPKTEADSKEAQEEVISKLDNE